ncbi:MAG: N-acetyltransferase [Planctomycetaceae bacterium]
MPVTHFKRLMMELDTRRVLVPEPTLPDGYEWAAWHPSTIDEHARAKFESFRDDLDGELFSCLSDESGCRRLMYDISHNHGFLSQATWLIRFVGNPFLRSLPCATIQGLRKQGNVGGVQNVAVIPEHRGFGLGRALMLQSIKGYQLAGIHRIRLEVTAANRPAVNLYRSIGFEVRRISYRTVEQFFEADAF